ncbi:MAG: hypothetical protein JWM11_4738 [Planctomycetaceae bacterium]|nr:hypothetical protein [Planctomycetaceae bacterium]
MEAILFIGLQGSGKSSYYKERFFGTHVHISLDLFRTRDREQRFLDVCLMTRQRFVVDNTNPGRAERVKYFDAAKSAGYSIHGYYFESKIDACVQRNAGRRSRECVPLAAILSTSKKLELPRRDEGFDKLFYVRLLDGTFHVEEWRDEV